MYTAPADGRQRELRIILDDELARLPGSLRSPVVLCYLEGLTHDEAAEELHWPVGTVRSRMARARNLLRRAPRPSGNHRGRCRAGRRPRSSARPGHPARFDSPCIIGVRNQEKRDGWPGIDRGRDTCQGSAPDHDDLQV